MDGQLEQQRRSHEERERLVDTMVREWMREKKTHKEKINSDHRLKLLSDRHMETTYQLKELYADKDGSRKEEISAIGGPNEFAEFYNRLKNLKEFQRTHPNEISIPLSVEFQEMNEAIEDPSRMESDLVDFTDEEGYGRYLDMHELHDKYLNLKGVEKTDYLAYLTTFDRLFQYPKEKKHNWAYRQYIVALLEYLTDFISRVRPLMDINEEVKKAMEDFEKKWTEGSFVGWPKQEQVPKSAMAHGPAGYLDLSPYNNHEELMALGLDRLKTALSALGLKCGGTLEERSKRLMMTKGKRLEDLDPSLFAKPVKSGQQQAKQDPEQEKKKDVAVLEAQVYHFAELVSEQREATKENVERKQARVPGEEEEEEEEAPPLPSDDEDDDDIPYNPKNLPLGWDGKPIPYWLYKLHGLNIDFPCEICGNQVYKGPKAFQRHFSEWRHAHGMRCLGIPNTAHFANVTKIQDALQLWERLREQKELERFRPDVEEEYEDSQGNVVNKKTYQDLKRQGLL